MNKEIERKCILTGEVKEASDLLRFVKTPDSRLVPDFDKKLGGRGLYVSNGQKVLEEALKKNLFIKSIHLFLKIPEDFVQMVTNLLYQKGLAEMNLARKAGALLTGFEKVKAGIKQGKVSFLIEATDVAQDGRQKIDSLKGNIEVLRVYCSDDLSRALQKENTVYIAVLKSGIANMVYKHIKRYQTFLEN